MKAEAMRAYLDKNEYCAGLERWIEDVLVQRFKRSNTKYEAQIWIDDIRDLWSTSTFEENMRSLGYGIEYFNPQYETCKGSPYFLITI